MQTSQAIDYLEAADAAQLTPQQVARPMFFLLRAAARLAQREYPGMAGYYDPEIDCPRADPMLWRFAPAYKSEVLPQSPALKEKLLARIPDPWGGFMDSLLAPQ